MSMSSLFIVVVDDQALFRVNLVAELARHYAGEAEVRGVASAEEVLALARTPDVVLLDLQLQGSGVEGPRAVRLLAETGVRVLVVSGVRSAEMLAAVQRAGAHGYVCKDLADTDDLILAIEDVRRGSTHVQPALQQSIGAAARKMLSPRQQQVLRLEALGRTAGQIASELGLAERGVRRNIEAVLVVYPEFAKQNDRVRLALRLGLVTPWEVYERPALGGH
jgi:DNA-binding NarL/FixJ family response regulator